MDVKVLATGAWAFLATVWKIVDGIMTANKEVIQAVILRVQKDTADGTWSDEEKEQEVVDIVNNYIKPRLPWYANIFISDTMIRNWVKKACAKAASYKGTVQP